MIKKLFILLLISCYLPSLTAQTPLPIRQLLKADYMQGATFSFVAKDVKTDKIIYAYDSDRGVIPASVLKTVTTATALELLGEDFRYPTSLEYDGELKDGVLTGNLYIKGSGDPTLGSAHFTPDRNTFTSGQKAFLFRWVEAVRNAGIRKISGSVIADESIFDTEGVSPKWLQEDMGSYYGAGSYGLNVFDNLYRLHLNTGKAGDSPTILSQDPAMPALRFHNYLAVASVPTDSAFILGFPFSVDRYLYGAVPPNRSSYTLKGDIPDPALYLAGLLTEYLNKEGIETGNLCSSYRLLAETGQWSSAERKNLVTTYSPTLREIVRIVNERSHNLYADALLKTIGLQYRPRRGEVISSFGRGVKRLQAFWEEKGIDMATLHINDGSGLAATNRVSATFIADMLTYMATQSVQSAPFMQSFPQAGVEGSVQNFLKGTPLEGKALLKSGGMNRVRSYAGYINKDGNQYAVALFANNYSCEGREMIKALERLLVGLFSQPGLSTD